MARKVLSATVRGFAKPSPSVEPVAVESRTEFREWLRRHHDSTTSVQLRCWKRGSGKPMVAHRELLKEAICWGWIDTTVRRIDDASFSRTFVRRTPKGKWSTNTLRYAEEVIQAGEMQPAGHVALEHGKKNPVFDSEASKKPPPDELVNALKKNARAWSRWSAMPPSQQGTYVSWLSHAKREETVTRRIASIVRSLSRRKARPD